MAKKKTSKNSAKLSGQTFVVTGTLAGYSRADAKNEIEALGGKVSGSVSANTDCVVIGADPGSKADKAKQLGIKTLNEAAFKRLLGGAKKKTTKKVAKKVAKKKATKKKAAKETGEAKLSGQTFVVTGTFKDLSRAEAKEAIEAMGGKVSGSVSANTDCVVIGEDPRRSFGSLSAGSKEDMAKQLGIKTLNETAFKNLVYGHLGPGALLAAIEKKGRDVLFYADKSLRADRKVVLAAVKQDSYALEYADKALKSDRKVVLAAVKGSGGALEYADKALKADRKVVLAAVKSDSVALEFAAKSFKADREIVLAALKQWGGALQYAAKALQADREIVLAAVKTYGRALQFAAKALQADRGVVLAAVKQDGSAIYAASEELQQDEELKRIANQ
jgi:BRCT domain type II-containing protein